MPKYQAKDLEAFAKEHPHLVRTVIQLDKRKINSALRDGWKVPGLIITEGEDEEETEHDAAGAPERAQGTQEGIPTFLGNKKPEDAPRPLTEEEKGIKEIMIPTQEAPATPKKYDEKLMLPGEGLRDFTRRMELLDEAKRLEDVARSKAKLPQYTGEP